MRRKNCWQRNVYVSKKNCGVISRHSFYSVMLHEWRGSLERGHSAYMRNRIMVSTVWKMELLEFSEGRRRRRTQSHGRCSLLHFLEWFLAAVDHYAYRLSQGAERRAERLTRNAGVRHLELGRLTTEVVHRLGALDVAARLSNLRVSDRVDQDRQEDTW